ncbi:3473_t:CDS:2, partial [Acaulospora morrowiae]
DSDDLNKEDKRNKEKSNWIVYLAQTEKFSNNVKAKETSDQINKEKLNWIAYLAQTEEFSDDIKTREILNQVTERFSDDVKARETLNQLVHIVSIENGKDRNDQTSWYTW